MGLILSFLKGSALKLLAIAAAAVAVLGFLAKVKSAGRMEERAENLAKAAESARQRARVENEVAGNPDRAALRDELLRDWGRKR